MTEAGPGPQAAACAAAALSHWGLGGARLRFASARENIVYQAQARDGRSYALRIHRPGYHSMIELESENRWTTALGEFGIDTPRPVPTLAGPAYADVPFGSGERRVVGLIEWIDGTPMWQALRGQTVNPIALMTDIGRLIARMHQQAVQWRPGPGFSRARLDADGLLGENPVWHPFWGLPEMSAEESALVIDIRDRLHAVLLDYGQHAQTFSMIHADVLPQNIVIRDGRPFIFDFDDSAFGWHVHDLAVALLPLQNDPAFGQLARATVDGYRQVRALDDADLALLPQFLVIRQLSIIGWMNRKVTHALHVGEGQVATRAELLAPRIAAALTACRAIRAGLNPYPMLDS